MGRQSGTRLKVAHLTSVHAPFDTRIFHKECKTLARAGYDVVLVAPHERDEVVDGVRVRAVAKPATRRGRMLRTVRDVYRAAVAEDADVYHFHDPELIGIGLLLRRRGKPVVYDVHEDYGTSIRQKGYLPLGVRVPLAALAAAAEAWVSRFFTVVLAERYYARRFPRGTLVLNYPIQKEWPRPAAARANGNAVRLLYTGVVSEDRGAITHARLPSLHAGIEVHVVGRCSEGLADRMRQAAGADADRLHLHGVGFHVPYPRILQCYAEGGWTAGLALFPATPHYLEKELTKFFEYMTAGIPVLCSDFPTWRALMERTGAGLCVDPDDTHAVREALEYLTRNPERAAAMGENGRRAVAELYNWDVEAKRLLDMYAGLLGDRRLPADAPYAAQPSSISLA
jgi:glycosyltransferase involved in cell wall biosynthesis